MDQKTSISRNSNYMYGTMEDENKKFVCQLNKTKQSS